MRKVLGANRATLARHYIGNAVATSTIAGVIGLALAECGLPLVNAASGLTLKLTYLGRDGVLLPLVVLTLMIGLLAGIYPAMVLSRFRPQPCLPRRAPPA